MNFLSTVKISSMALCCAVAFNTTTQAKPQNQQVVSASGQGESEKVHSGVIKEAALELNHKCSNETGLLLVEKCQNKDNQQADEHQDIQIQAAEVRISGYGRFGLDYNDRFLGFVLVVQEFKQGQGLYLFERKVK